MLNIINADQNKFNSYFRHHGANYTRPDLIILTIIRWIDSLWIPFVFISLLLFDIYLISKITHDWRVIKTQVCTKFTQTYCHGHSCLATDHFHYFFCARILFQYYLRTLQKPCDVLIHNKEQIAYCEASSRVHHHDTNIGRKYHTRRQVACKMMRDSFADSCGIQFSLCSLCVCVCVCFGVNMNAGCCCLI